ncbi:unnamed protein product [Effrenium voratum]|nr:unnamed protein product [Effrenium voratum]
MVFSFPAFDMAMGRSMNWNLPFHGVRSPTCVFGARSTQNYFPDGSPKHDFDIEAVGLEVEILRPKARVSEPRPCSAAVQEKPGKIGQGVCSWKDLMASQLPPTPGNRFSTTNLPKTGP